MIYAHTFLQLSEQQSDFCVMMRFVARYWAYHGYLWQKLSVVKNLSITLATPDRAEALHKAEI